MAIDAGIYNALSQPRKSAFDYAREFEDQDMQREQMGMARQQNALALRTGQMKADEYTRGVEAQNALSAYLSSAPDLGTEQGVAGLYKAAPTLASAALKDYGERQKTSVDVAGKRATNTKTEFETRTAKRTQAIADIAALNSPEEAVQSIRSHLANGDIDEVKFQSLMSTLPKDPAQFPTWQRNMVRSIMDAAKREELDQKARNDLIGPDGKVNQQLLNAKQSVAKSGASNISVSTGQKGYENESKLRNDFKSEPIYKDFQDMKSAHAQIKGGIAQGTPISDVAVATKIMKLLDPGSVVRESELAIAMAASGKLDRIQNYLQMQISGEKLTPQQRKDFGALADELMGAASQAYNAKRAEYEGFGKTYGLNPSVLGAPADGVAGKKPSAPATAFSDAEKERRYQEWKAKQK